MMNCLCNCENRDYKAYICEKTFINYDCCICLQEIKKGEKIIVLKCNHIYHRDCIEAWFNKKRKCPYCNMKIKK